jgi:hypothetical protein
VPLEYLSSPRRPRAVTTTTETVTSALTIVIVDLIDVITVTAGPIVAMTTRIDVIITATTAVMIDETM